MGVGLARFALIVFAAIAAACGATAGDETEENRGYLKGPPVYITDEPDILLTGLGIEMPQPGKAIPAADILTVDSQSFREDGAIVQPGLSVNERVIRVGAVAGVGRGWAAGMVLPWVRTRVRGLIGGLPANGTAEGLGDLVLFGKRELWSSGDGRRLMVSAGIEPPTGVDDVSFRVSNAVTNAYYPGGTARMPLGWQPGSGSWDTLIAVAYGRIGARMSYVGLAAAKVYGTGAEDVRLGNIFVAATSATYGLAEWAAASLGLTLRVQGDDSYPNAPPPGVGQSALAGTTTHGTTLFVDPSVRFTVLRRVTVGFGVRIPIVRPDDGMVPEVRLSFIFYPSLTE